MNQSLNVLGRLLIAALFLPAGLSKITGFEGTVGYIGAMGLPAPALGAVIAIAVEVLGGLALIVGWQTRIAALVLSLFTLVASVIFHAYWAAPADQAFVVQLLFFKNIAVIGGLWILAAQGPGAFSLDARKTTE